MGRQVEHDGDFAVRYRERNVERNAAPQLEKLHFPTSRQRDGFGEYGLNARLRPQGAARVEERHGDQVVTEHHAPDAHQRKNTNQVSVIASCQVNAFMAKHIINKCAPAQTVKMCVAPLSCSEQVPLFLATAKPFDGYHQAAPRVVASAPSWGK